MARIPVESIVGDYQISATTGAITAGAAAKLIFFATNTDSGKLIAIQRLLIDGVIATTAFAAGQVLYQAHIARNVSGAGSGGTALTISGINANLMRQVPATGLNTIRIATTAALTAPTWVLDTQAVGQLNSHSSAGVGAATPIIGNQYVPNNGILFEADEGRDELPIILGANEGVAITVTVPATGVWTAGVTMKWKEASVF